MSDAVYYKDVYWNDHDIIRESIENRLSGTLAAKGTTMSAYFRNNYAKEKPFQKALFINCGNGWVEREFYDAGIFSEGVGFDYSENLLNQARDEAKGRPLSYFQADCNLVELEENSYDLIVNFAAMHHVQYINRMNAILASALKPDGVYLNYDYVGPHRNQYGASQWKLMEEVYERLPVYLRGKNLVMPDVPQMLLDDPTEAIHSDLIFPTFYTYFSALERKDTGGGVAYQIMHNNPPLFVRNAHTDWWVKELITLDSELTDSGVVPSLFSYFVGQPKKSVLQDKELMTRLREEEEDRELRAKENGGRYF